MRRPLGSRRPSGATRSSVTCSSTPSSTTTPVSRTPRSTMTRPPSLPSSSCTEPSIGSANTASPSNGCCRTTEAPTDRTCGVTPGRPCRSPRSGRGRADHRPTARWSASTAPWPTGGLRPLLHQRARTPRRTVRLAPPVQPAPSAHGLREPAAVLAFDQRPRSVHLDLRSGTSRWCTAPWVPGPTGRCHLTAVAGASPACRGIRGRGARRRRRRAGTWRPPGPRGPRRSRRP